MRIFKFLPFLFFSLAACSESTAPTTASSDQTELVLQCHKDTDCKGDRICDTGKCIAPVAAPAQLAPVAQSDSTNSSCPQTKIIFSCTTKKNKYVEVCDRDANVSYTFGKIGLKPEISLSIPRNVATTEQWNGMGAISYSVNIPNGNTVYSVFWSAERNPDAVQPVSAGIYVLINGSSVATVMCNPDTAIQNIEGINLPPTQNDI